MEQFERNFTNFLVNNAAFQAFAHHSSKKAKDLAGKVENEIFKTASSGKKPDVRETVKRLVDSLKK